MTQPSSHQRTNPLIPERGRITWPAWVRSREDLQRFSGELGPRQVEHVLRLTEQLSPTVLDDVLLALYRPGIVRPRSGSHHKVFRIRGDGIPEEEGIHPRVPVP